MSTDLAYSEWTGLLSKLEAAEEELVKGRPAAFQALWSQNDDVTLCGGFGGVARGWQNVTARLNWVSAKYSDGTRTREEIASMVWWTSPISYKRKVFVQRWLLRISSPLKSCGLQWCFAMRRRLADYPAARRFTGRYTAAEIIDGSYFAV
jgi:hypothetical protein